jgi:cytochrome c
MKLKPTSWLHAAITCAMVLAICTDAMAANPRIIVEVGQTVMGGWRVPGVGPVVAVNSARQVAYVAKIAKTGPVRITVMRNRQRVVWEGKRLGDGSVVIDIEEDACPSINRRGEIAVPAQIRKDGLVRKAVIGGDRALTWIGKKVGGQTITRWDSLDCAPLDDRGRIAYFANFDSRTGPQRGILIGDRPVLRIGQVLLDGSQVVGLLDDVAMNSAGNFVVGATVAPSDTALLSRSRVLLRDGDVANDGTTIDLPFALAPAINDRADIVVRADNHIVTHNEVVFRESLELPDRAVIDRLPRFDLPVIDPRGIVSVRANVEHEDRREMTALITQKGVAVMDGDLLPDGRTITDIESPGINGRGEIAFVALVGGQQAVLLGKPTMGCRNLLDRSVPVPDGYGAAYHVLGNPTFDRELTVRVRCGFSRAILQVGSGRRQQSINPEAFLWQDGEWLPIELQGEERGDDGWFIGAASANLMLSGAQLLQEQQVRAQICTVEAGARKCGCRDFSCRETFWQLQAFRRPASDEPGSDPPPFEPPPPEPPPGDGEDQTGARVFLRCRACHVADAPTNRVGPHLVGIFGRRAGTVEGFRYSDALAESGIVWDDDSLSAFLADPRGFVPGNRMAFAGLRVEQEILDLLAYLRVVAGSS